MSEKARRIAHDRLFQERTLLELVDRLLAQHFTVASLPPQEDREAS